VCTSGGVGKLRMAVGEVAGDGQVELRKTGKIRAGQLVRVDDLRIRVVGSNGADQRGPDLVSGRSLRRDRRQWRAHPRVLAPHAPIVDAMPWPPTPRSSKPRCKSPTWTATTMRTMR
jgi:hypothetical protein